MRSKYKIGDIVKIVDINRFMNCRNRNPDGKMDCWAGKTMTIRDYAGRNDEYYMKEDIEETGWNAQPGWIWDETMIEGVIDTGINDINQDDLMSFLER